MLQQHLQHISDEIEINWLIVFQLNSILTSVLQSIFQLNIDLLYWIFQRSSTENCILISHAWRSRCIIRWWIWWWNNRFDSWRQKDLGSKSICSSCISRLRWWIYDVSRSCKQSIGSSFESTTTWRQSCSTGNASFGNFGIRCMAICNQQRDTENNRTQRWKATLIWIATASQAGKRRTGQASTASHNIAFSSQHCAQMFTLFQQISVDSYSICCRLLQAWRAQGDMDQL